MALTVILANLLTTGCALLLIRRGPTRRLRLLSLTVGLMSLSQTAVLLHAQGIWQAHFAFVAATHQSLVAVLSLLAIYLLGTEIYDRNFTDSKLRLVEHETSRTQQLPVPEPVLAPPVPIEKPYGDVAAGLLALYHATTPDRGPLITPTPRRNVLAEGSKY